VLLLALVLAEPRQAQATRTHQIVVVDGSAAMAATDVAPSRFARARLRLAAIIGGMGPGDSLSLVEAGSQAFLAGQAMGAAAEALPARLIAPGGAADLTGAAALVRGLLAERGLGQAQLTFLAAPETPLPEASALKPRVERIGRSPLDDQRLASLAVRCLPASGMCEAFAIVQNTSTQPRHRLLTARTDQQSLGRRALLLPARGSLDLTFAVPATARWLQATLLGNDAMLSDDTAAALVPRPWPLRVLLVSDNPGRLAAALRAIAGLSLRIVSASGYQEAGYQSYDCVVLDRLGSDSLPPLPALLIDPPATDGGLNVRAGTVYLPADSVNESDPLVAGLSLYSMAGVGERLAVPAWARVVVGGPNGPLLVDGIWNGERTAVVPLPLGQSAFTQDPAFPLLIERLVRWLVPAPPASVAVGDAVALPSDVTAVADPSGSPSSGAVILADKAGIYTVAAGTGARQAGEPLFAARASMPGDAHLGSLADTLGPSVGTSMGTTQRDLWPLVLIAALLGLGTEWWFYARRT
jgi:Ca-activated chloride channel family protein